MPVVVDFWAEWGIRGIPAVKAVRDGRLVAEFVGAQPEAFVKEWFDGLIALERRREERDRALAEARARMLQVFEVLGPDHPLTRRYRALLAQALF